MFDHIIQTLTAAMVVNRPVTVLYRDADGIASVRHIRVNAVKRCKNGRTIVRAYDLRRDAPRSFSLAGVLDARDGVTVARVTL